MESPTILSLAASGLYAAVSVACIVCIVLASGKGRHDWERGAWIALAVLFAGLALYRFFGTEEWLRELMREWLRERGGYGDRRTYQRPLAAGLIMATLAAAGFAAYRIAQSLGKQGLLIGRRASAVIVALGSTGGMITLVLMRLISLSPIDKLLYGSLKLNWIADIGFSLAVLASAIVYSYTALSRRR